MTYRWDTTETLRRVKVNGAVRDGWAEAAAIEAQRTKVRRAPNGPEKRVARFKLVGMQNELRMARGLELLPIPPV